MQKRKMPRDPNQRAFETVRLALGETDEAEPTPKDPARVERGKVSGAKGGKLRAERLTPERRAEIARKAAAARWGQKQG